MNIENNTICGGNYSDYFNGLPDDYRINGGKRTYKCQELEVFQLINN